MNKDADMCSTKKKRGRPRVSEGRKRVKRVSVRFTIPEYMRFRQRVRTSGKRQCDYLKEAALEGVVKARRTQEDVHQIRMLDNDSNNLNQITRLAHQKGLGKLEDLATEVLQNMNKILTRILKT